MIQEFKEDMKTALEAAIGPGLHLEGITRVQLGDTFPLTRYHPAITVDHEDRIEPKRTSGKVEISIDFVVVLYTSSIKADVEEANAHLNNLVLRRSGTSYIGLHPFLSRFTSWTDGGGQTWKVDLLPDSARGAVKSEQAQFASVAAAYRLRLSTWLNPTQY